MLGTLAPFGGLPDFQSEALLLFGTILVVGMVGGHLVSRSKWLPHITGYLLVGFILGAGGLNVLNADMLKTMSIFSDVATAMVAYQLGRYVDLTWLRHERWLVATVVVSAMLCFMLVSGALYWAGQPVVLAGLGGVMAIGTAPAVIAVIVRDLNAEGKITRRLVTMTALNNGIALIALYALLPIISNEKDRPFLTLLWHALYSIGGSLLLAWLLYLIAIPLARLLGRQPSRQFVLVMGLISLAIGVAHALQLPVMLCMLMFAILSKNLDRQFDLMELEFGVTRELFIIMLFILLGASIRIDHLSGLTGAIGLLIVMRLIAMIIGIGMFTPAAKMTWKQSGWLVLATLPMSETGIGMMSSLSILYPNAASEIAPVLAGSLIVLELIGPVATQFALRQSGESGRAS